MMKLMAVAASETTIYHAKRGPDIGHQVSGVCFEGDGVVALRGSQQQPGNDEVDGRSGERNDDLSRQARSRHRSSGERSLLRGRWSCSAARLAAAAWQ